MLGHVLVTCLLYILDAGSCVSQMPVILLPLHFGRDPKMRPPIPSCQRAVAIRTFITSDFMTGLAAVPGKDLPLEVCLLLLCVYKDHPLEVCLLLLLLLLFCVYSGISE